MTDLVSKEAVLALVADNYKRLSDLARMHRLDGKKDAMRMYAQAATEVGLLDKAIRALPAVQGEAEKATCQRCGANWFNTQVYKGEVEAVCGDCGEPHWKRFRADYHMSQDEVLAALNREGDSEG